MSGYFELAAATGSEFLFNLKAGNNQVILTSERYATKHAAQGGISSVQKNASLDASYQRKTAKDNSSYFVLVATNGEAIGTSQMYASTSAMEAGIASVKTNAPGATTKDLTTA
jgi:uncharacterized protein YegP (UPF0339 family)